MQARGGGGGGDALSRAEVRPFPPFLCLRVSCCLVIRRAAWTHGAGLYERLRYFPRVEALGGRGFFAAAGLGGEGLARALGEVHPPRDGSFSLAYSWHAA